MQLDADGLVPLVQEFGSYGLWGLFALLFMIFGLPQIAPIITALGTILNERHKSNLSHQRSMMKLRNKEKQDLIGKPKGK